MKVTPFLMFVGQAEEAMAYYQEIFPLAEIVEVEKYAQDEPDRAGTVKRARFRIGAQEIYLIDSPPIHDFTFTPSFSFLVDFDHEAELRDTAEKLSGEGEVLMPLDNYDFSRLYTWVSDRFGVSWQLNLP